MQGNLSQISLNDILLLAIGGKKSGILRMSRGKEIVDVYLSQGDIVHASCPIGEGEKALLYPVTWGEGSFTLLPNGSPPAQTIKKQSAEILEEVIAMSKEWEHIRQIIPSGKTILRIADLSEEQNGPVTVPHAGWRVLSKIDGARSVQEIAEILRVPYAYTAKVIYNLHKSGLVEIILNAPKTSAKPVPPAFFQRLVTILTEVMGPMASVIVQDQIETLGESQESFPEHRLDEFISLVRAEITDNQLKDKFQQMISEEMSSFKRL